MYSKQFRPIHFRYKRGAETLKKIRSAFVEKVFLQGFRQAKIHDLARHAKLTRGAFYNYWSSMEECLADIMLIRADLDEDQSIKIELEKGISAPSLLVHRIREFLQIKSRDDLQNYYFPLVMLQEKNFLNAELSELLRKCLRNMRIEWEKLIERDQKEGLIRLDIERESCAVCILNFLSGMIQNMNHDSKSGELNRPLKAAMDHFVCSLFTKEHLNYYPLTPTMREQVSLKNKPRKAEKVRARL